MQILCVVSQKASALRRWTPLGDFRHPDSQSSFIFPDNPVRSTPLTECRDECHEIGGLWTDEELNLLSKWYSGHFVAFICSVLFFSCPRSDDWPHRERTFSIYLYPLHSDWLFHAESCPRLHVNLSIPRLCVVFLACMQLTLFLHYLFLPFLQATPLFPHGVTIVW